MWCKYLSKLRAPKGKRRMNCPEKFKITSSLNGEVRRKNIQYAQIFLLRQRYVQNEKEG